MVYPPARRGRRAGGPAGPPRSLRRAPGGGPALGRSRRCGPVGTAGTPVPPSESSGPTKDRPLLIEGLLESVGLSSTLAALGGGHVGRRTVRRPPRPPPPPPPPSGPPGRPPARPPRLCARARARATVRPAAGAKGAGPGVAEGSSSGSGVLPPARRGGPDPHPGGRSQKGQGGHRGPA